MKRLCDVDGEWGDVHMLVVRRNRTYLSLLNKVM